MQKYLSVELILAKPMNRQDYNDYRGWTLPENENGDDDGYLVEHVDGGQSNHPDHKGYISWSPTDVFESSSRKTIGLTFGLAVESLKLGKKVSRVGWNGKGMYLTLIFSGNAMYQGFDMQDCVGIKTVNNLMQPGWLPSQADMLAEDWMILD